ESSLEEARRDRRRAGAVARRGRGAGGRPQARVREVHPAQRPRGDPARGPLGAGGRGEHLVQGGVGGRAARADRLRAPLRAHHVHGLGARAGGRVRPVARGGGRAEQRLDEPGPHQLLRVRPVQRAAARALARRRPPGVPAAHDGQAQARPPARRREERAPAELRQPAVRPRLRDDPRRALPERAPVLVVDDRLDGRPLGGEPRRREAVLPHLLRAEQRHAHDRRRLRPRLDEGVGGALLRRDPARAADPGAPRRAPRGARARHLPRARGQGAAAAPLHHVALGEGVPPRRRHARRARLRAGRRQELAAVQAARLRRAERAGRERRADEQPPRRDVHRDDHPQARADAGGDGARAERGGRPARRAGDHAARARAREEQLPRVVHRPARERELEGRPAQLLQLLRGDARLRAAGRGALRPRDRRRRAAGGARVPGRAQGRTHRGAGGAEGDDGLGGERL
ncbi:MAG: Zinc protease, partial [uncultured Gemmatimonadaceae bacterium]